MSDDKSQNEDLCEQIQREHDELRELLGNVHQTLVNRSESVANVAQVMGSLREHAITHFREEEEDGFFDQVISIAPRVTERANGIRDEHQQLAAEVDRLVEMTSGGDGSPAWWQQLNDAFHEFSKDLMHHESKENELLQEVYTEDIGSAD